MSLAFHLAADAVADLRRLDLWLQEEVLDEIDRLCNHPDDIPPTEFDDATSDYSVVRERDGKLSEVLLRVSRNEGRQSLTVLGVKQIV